MHTQVMAYADGLFIHAVKVTRVASAPKYLCSRAGMESKAAGTDDGRDTGHCRQAAQQEWTTVSR